MIKYIFLPYFNRKVYTQQEYLYSNGVHVFIFINVCTVSKRPSTFFHLTPSIFILFYYNTIFFIYWWKLIWSNSCNTQSLQFRINKRLQFDFTDYRLVYVFVYKNSEFVTVFKWLYKYHFPILADLNNAEFLLIEAHKYWKILSCYIPIGLK